MGCHTWVYLEYNMDNLEEDRNKAIKKLQDKKNNHIMRHDLEWTRKQFYDLKRYYYKTLHQLQSGCKSRNIIELILLKGYISPIFYKGKYYKYYSKIGDDLFRVSDYPIDILDSYEETIIFIKKYLKEKPEKLYSSNIGEALDNINFLNEIEVKMKEFWDSYPNAIIKFG